MVDGMVDDMADDMVDDMVDDRDKITVDRSDIDQIERQRNVNQPQHGEVMHVILRLTLSLCLGSSSEQHGRSSPSLYASKHVLSSCRLVMNTIKHVLYWMKGR